jgi:uncharacterized protein (TIGR02246 family)
MEPPRRDSFRPGTSDLPAYLFAIAASADSLPAMKTIAALVEAWTSAWNRHDMRAAAALVRRDVDFVTVAGLWLRGRAEFLEHHQAIHGQHLRDSAWQTHGYEVRPLSDALGLVHLEWTIAGERQGDGGLRAPRSGVFTWLVDHPAGDWGIVAAHNTDLRPGVAHRLYPRRSC